MVVLGLGVSGNWCPKVSLSFEDKASPARLDWTRRDCQGSRRGGSVVHMVIKSGGWIVRVFYGASASSGRRFATVRWASCRPVTPKIGES